MPATAAERSPLVEAGRLGWRAAPAASAGLVVLTVATGVLPAGAAYLTKLLLDALARGHGVGLDRVTALAVLAALAAGSASAAGYAAGLMSAVVQQRVRVHAAGLLYGRINAMPGLRPFEDPAFHDRVVLAEQALEQAPGDVTSFLLACLQRSVGMLAYVGVLVTLWPPMALLLVVAAVPTALTQRWLARQQCEVLEATAGARRRYDYYRRLSLDPQAAKEVRAYNLGGLLHRRVTLSLSEASAPELAQQRRATVAEVLFTLVNAAVCAAGGAVVVRAAVRGEVSLGGVAFFLAAVTAVQGALTGVIGQLGTVSRSLGLFLHYLAVLRSATDLLPGQRPVLPLHDELQFQNVWFRYGPDRPWVLRGLTLRVPAGQAVGLVGVNGAGKSTVVKLLLRLYDPERGQILWNGVPLNELDLDGLRAQVAVTFQDFTRYELSARENIAVGDLAALNRPERVVAAANEVGMDDVLRALPEGYDTVLTRTRRSDGGGAGQALSGGQWQRLAVARALLRTGSSLVVLDEPSSSLDPDAEARFHELLRGLCRGRTSILVSHRLNALRHVDTVVVIEDGVVVEQGSHDRLIDLDGQYARLFRLQAQGYQPTVAVE